MGRFLILSQGGDGVGLALRLKLEGHEVKLWHREDVCHGKGLVDFAEEYSMGQTVVADCTGFGILLDKFRDDGVRIFGGSSFHDKLETDRKFAEAVMKKAGIETPRSVRVKSWEDARKKVEELAKESDDGRVVLKPEGNLSGNLPSYVASDFGDALVVLAHWEKSNSGEMELTVQQFIEGQDVSTEGWFNGEDWIPGMFNHTLEKKHVLNGDLGPSGGCAGNLVWRCEESDPIVRELKKLTGVLRERRYVGPIDLNCVVNEEGCYGLEFTPRFGYDSFPTTLVSLASFDFGAFLEDCASGNTSDSRISDGFGCGIRLSLPPWPSEKYEAETGISVRGIEKGDYSFYPYNVMMDGEDLVSSGGVGILGVINARGEVVGEGFARAEEMISRLKIPDVQYRTDLGKVSLAAYREFNRVLRGEEDLEGWYGVDLDGTLAWHRTGQEGIGSPLPAMVSRIRRWVKNGKEVRILTARVSVPGEKAKQAVAIYDWLKMNLGYTLEVTSEKDPCMIELWDDRVTEVEKNEGVAA